MSSSLPSSLHTSFPWNSEPHAIWIATSLVLKRNLSRYNFPSKIQEPELDQIMQTLKGSFIENAGLEKPTFVESKELSATDKELIFEHFLFLKGFQESPNGSGVIMDEKGEFLALINTGNHLEMRALNINTPWENTWNALTQIDNTIGQAHGFAFSPKFGYLTADPAQCGTGLIVNAYLHLPALIHANQLESALANSQQDELIFMDLSGDFIIIQNNFTIGLSEEAILHAVQTAATKLIGAEKTMRAHLKEEQNTEIKDLISKAFGLIVHSFQLETKEALDLLSLMKLGLALGYISGVSDAKLNELFFKCRRGHLSRLFPELKEPKEIAKQRADFLQQEVQGITLSPELQ
ncbi:MAG: Protein-arginine kinase [Chlamydiae bacterium]|nr:Protein-arginine kinase [Chlamydiota bacterium]